MVGTDTGLISELAGRSCQCVVWGGGWDVGIELCEVVEKRGSGVYK